MNISLDNDNNNVMINISKINDNNITINIF